MPYKEMHNHVDPFPTGKLNVPYLKEVLDRLRDPAQKRFVCILHVESPEEGDWILANIHARLERGKISVLGPEPLQPSAVIEQALYTKVSVALLGEVRRAEEAHAMRTAASLGLHVVAFVAVKTRVEFENVLAALGPWRAIKPFTPMHS